MLETMVEAGRPPIPAVMKLRARYRGNRAAYAADKIRRNRQVGIFSRPSREDRLDNGAAKNYYRRLGPTGRWAVKRDAAADEAARRVLKHKAENKQPYAGSNKQAAHRGKKPN